MKTLLISLLLIPVAAFSQVSTRTFQAQVRTEENMPIVDDVILTDLTSNDSFDGSYFKIVKGKDEEAIKFDADEALTFRAATAYYHLTKARKYFIEKVKADYVSTIPKMTIRIEHKNQFSELGHYANDNMEPQFNNALTIPSGQGLSSHGVKPWGMEIWFRPRKNVNISEIKVDESATRELKVLMGGFRTQMHMQSLQRWLSQVMMASTNDKFQGNPFSMDSLFRTAGSSLMIEAGYLLIDPITKATSRHWYWLDTALVPEIIYHEYSHAALSDRLVLSHSTAIIEGMADFFAGQIADSPTLAKKIKQHNTFNGKDATKKTQYMQQWEMGEYANSDFVFGLLWEMRNIVGDERGVPFMYELRKTITTNSSIHNELIEGILKTCEAMCETPFIDRLRILKALNLRKI